LLERKEMSKLLYIDTETTGLFPNKHGITQIAAIVVIDGDEVDSVNLSINPETYRTFTPAIDDEALSIQGRTREEIAMHYDSNYQFKEFVSDIAEHLGEDEKFQIVGYNTSFDIGFIKAWFRDNDAKFSDFFTYKDIDVFAMVKHLRLLGLMGNCENDRLSTVCEYFGIHIDAHDAMNDIVATRDLYKHIVNEYITAGAKI